MSACYTIEVSAGHQRRFILEIIVPSQLTSNLFELAQPSSAPRPTASETLVKGCASESLDTAPERHPLGHTKTALVCTIVLLPLPTSTGHPLTHQPSVDRATSDCTTGGLSRLRSVGSSASHPYPRHPATLTGRLQALSVHPKPHMKPLDLPTRAF